MIETSPRILRTDVSGMPIEWIGFEETVKLHCLEQILYPMGSSLYVVRGGINAKTGCRSTLEVHSIICTLGQSRAHLKRHPSYTPPLNNKALFRRDTYLCLYCGGQFLPSQLSRDHVRPLSRGGADVWQNVVTACRRCNHRKGDQTPEEARQELLAVPFIPTHAEYIYLSGRQILADQMEFLLSHFPRNSPLHERIGEAT
ncbi:MAG TPA: HNH endonuclease [Gammaproteobacteria bacterium]|nr:HNH endonuclease [Gammaproteobacteria bacterium]|tara:strand:- start:211 stop:810 length:600 start_codon:yes stop_codon:yes gene_type:complete